MANITDRRYGVSEGLAAKIPCCAVATSNITLSGTQTVDGVALAIGDRVLVTAQTSSVDNGPYVVANGDWTRPSDFDGALDVTSGTLIFVTSGTTYGSTLWYISTAGDITIGTTGLSFAIYPPLAGETTITTLGTVTTGVWHATTITEVYGGTNQATYATGDTLYASATNTLSKLTGNITTTRKFLRQTGTGTGSAAPTWDTIVAADVPGSALTKTDDTNVTLTLGGSASTALLNAASITVGWTGSLGVTRGGTGTGTQFTQGNMVFAGASGVYSQDTTLTFDATNKILASQSVKGTATLEVNTTPSANVSVDSAYSMIVANQILVAANNSISVAGDGILRIA